MIKKITVIEYINLLALNYKILRNPFTLITLIFRIGIAIIFIVTVNSSHSEWLKYLLAALAGQYAISKWALQLAHLGIIQSNYPTESRLVVTNISGCIYMPIITYLFFTLPIKKAFYLSLLIFMIVSGIMDFMGAFLLKNTDEEVYKKLFANHLQFGFLKLGIAGVIFYFFRSYLTA